MLAPGVAASTPAVVLHPLLRWVPPDRPTAVSDERIIGVGDTRGPLYLPGPDPSVHSRRPATDRTPGPLADVDTSFPTTPTLRRATPPKPSPPRIQTLRPRTFVVLATTFNRDSADPSFPLLTPHSRARPGRSEVGTGPAGDPGHGPRAAPGDTRTPPLLPGRALSTVHCVD